jgi:hypothetical protein
MGGQKERRQFNSAGMLTRYIRTTTGGSTTLLNDDTYVYNSLMLPDSITKWTGIYAGTRDVYDYDNNGNILYTLRWEFNTNPMDWWPSWQWTHTYHNNKVVKIYAEQWDPNFVVWDPGYVDSFIATGTGSDSMYVRYSWNGTGYNETWRHRYKRDGSNRILSDSTFQNGSFDSVTYFQYDAQGRLVVDSSMVWVPIQMQPGSHHAYRYNAQSGITAIKTFHANPVGMPPVLASIDSFTYNVTNQVTSRRNYDSTSGQLTASVYPDIQYFYYEPIVGVAEVAAPDALQLYPVPATTYINISMSFTKPQAFSVRIFDMQGRLVNKWQEQPQQTYNKQIPLTGIAPGQYTLQIFAGSESASRQFMVVR